MSPNADFVPMPRSQSNITLRSDLYYGEDDPLLWPQPYNSVYCHLAAIQHKPGSDDASIMWEAFDRKRDFEWSNNTQAVEGIGRWKKRS
jgi:hypothetical protein